MSRKSRRILLALALVVAAILLAALLRSCVSDQTPENQTESDDEESDTEYRPNIDPYTGIELEEDELPIVPP